MISGAITHKASAPEWSMANTFTGTENAAGFLARHLNNDYEYWMKFLKRDQRRTEKNRDIPIWGMIHDSVCYDISNLCQYVARRNPTALGYPQTRATRCTRELRGKRLSENFLNRI